MRWFDVRYKWNAAEETCKGVYSGESKDDVIKQIEDQGNTIISIRLSKRQEALPVKSF